MNTVKKPVKKKVIRKPKASDPASMLRHYHFSLKYVELNFNGTQAYLATYGEEYKASNNKEMTEAYARSSASRMLTNVNVQKYIEQITKEAFEECQISINSVLSKYKRWSESDITDVIEWKNIKYIDKDNNKKSYLHIAPREMKDVPLDTRDCIESMSQGKDGFKVTMVSKKAANDMLFKYLGLDKSESNRTPDIHIHFDKQDEGL